MHYSDLLIHLNPPAVSLLGAFRLCAASQHFDGITAWLCQPVLAHLGDRSESPVDTSVDISRPAGMSVATDSPSPGSSPGVGFSTPQAGRDLIHAAQLEQLKAQLGQLDESFPGFGAELQASLPGLPEDSSLLKRSRRELASLAMRLCSSSVQDLILTLLSRREDGTGAKKELLALGGCRSKEV